MKNRLLQIVNRLELSPKDKSDLVNIILNNNTNNNTNENSNQELYAYPVEVFDRPLPKVVELGGEKLYRYLGEISISPAMEEVEGTFDNISPTIYLYQPIYEGVLHEGFVDEEEESYLNLYFGNDKLGYTSLKIEYSEDPNNLKWFYDGFGMLKEGVGAINFAYDAKNRTLRYRADPFYSYNIKVYILDRAKKLDINLIPNEIARKEDLSSIESRLAALEAKLNS